MIVAITNIKGGVSKSTLSVLSTIWLSERGHRVLLVDCDAQQSSSQWVTEAAPELPTLRMSDPNQILNELSDLAGDYDYVIADGPGSNSEISRALLLEADQALIPCKASMLEVRALSQATEVVRQAQKVRQGVPSARIVLTMVQERYRLTQDMKKASEALGFPVCEHSLSLRQIYADAPGQGQAVWNMKVSDSEALHKAKRETGALFRELFPNAGKKPSLVRSHSKSLSAQPQ